MRRYLLIFLIILNISFIDAQTCEYTPASNSYLINIDGNLSFINTDDIPYDIICGSTVSEYSWIFNLNAGPSIIDCHDCHLPVDFLSIDYDCSRRTLNWETLTETNNDYFLIKIGSTYSHSELIVDKEIQVDGAGNSSHYNSYVYDLESVQEYIELYQVDYDGTTVLLGTEYSNCSDDDLIITMFPNPAKEGESVTISEHNTVQIFDMIGKEVYANIIGNKITGLSSGFYIVIIDNRYTFKLIINRSK